MEVIVAIIVFFVCWMIFKWVVSAGARTVGAAAKAAVGKGSFSDNMELAFQGMGPMTIRFADARIGENGEGPSYKAIEVKGLFPVESSTRVGFVTSVMDNTDGELAPVMSSIEAFQEPGSIAYQHITEVGDVSPDQGFVSWSQVGAVIPDLLTTPNSGRRKLTAILRLVDMDRMPSIELGRHDEGDSGILWTRVLDFEHTVDEKGYLEAAEDRDEAQALSICIGMAVAMADGSLDDVEGAVLKEWIAKNLAPFSGEKRDHLKRVFNEAMSDAYDFAKSGDLSLSVLTERLNDIAEKSTRYETIELCFDVMTADGVADAEEMKVIRKVAEALELDFDEIEKIRDQKIIDLDTSVSKQSSVEDLLGIETDWEIERIKRHLRMEFQKWNNRLNVLEEGGERDNAQRMLDMIADARKKYD